MMVSSYPTTALHNGHVLFPTSPIFLEIILVQQSCSKQAIKPCLARLRAMIMLHRALTERVQGLINILGDKRTSQTGHFCLADHAYGDIFQHSRYEVS